MNHINYEKTAIRVSNVSIIGNSVLTIFKLLAGLFAQSSAMVSDAVHSASDVFSSIIVIIGVKLAGKEPDAEHPYGHERMECVAASILAIVLCVIGLFIGHNAIESLSAPDGGGFVMPGVLALAAAVVSIVTKEAMYWYTRHYAKLLDSGALMAEAWHHRSDALSSVGALIGIGGARMGYLWLEPVASLIICVFILKAAFDIYSAAMEKMVDHSCSAEKQKELKDCAMEQEGVLGIDSLSTREFGNKIYVDMEISAEGSLSLDQSHTIAERVHNAIEKEFPEVKHIMVHVNPCRNPE